MGVFIWLHLAFIILTVILSSCCAIEFVDEPNETYGLENQQITLACSAIGPQNTTITWHKAHNVSIVHGSTKVMGNTVYSTYGFHLTNDNEGDYYCNASDGRHWVQSKKASVRISFLNEKFNLEPQSKVVNIGDTVLLECIPPFGLPSPTVEWLKENSSLLPSNRLQLMDVGNLRIDRITWKDSGHYTCVAKSFAYRRESSKAYLTVRQRPYFIVSPKSQSVPVHSVFEMSCRAAGEPSPVVVWRREPSLPSIPYSRVRLLLSGTLRFVSVQSNDSGYYVCRAVSSTGIIESVAYINVVTPPGLVVTPPSKIYTYEGNRVELFCSVTGSPFPDVRWLQWSTKTYFIPTVSASGRIYVTTAGNLIILAVRVEDTSTYECRASSPAGLTRSLTDVQVLFNQKLIPGRVGAVSAPHIYGRIFGSPTAVRIFCGVPLDPVFNYSHESHSVTLKSEFSTKSHIIWLNNGEFVPKSSSSGSRISIEADGSLLIYPFKAHDAGNYTCSVYRKISHRFAQYTFTVSSKDQNDSVYQLHTYDQLPSPPVNAGIVSVGDTWVVLKWFDNNPSESTSYKVYALPQIYSRITVQSAQHYENLKHLETSSDHMKSDELQMSSSKSFKLDTWFTVVEKTYHTQIRITGLIPDTGYWIEVRKVNSFGMSSGALVPYIVYTVRRPSEVIFSHSSLVNETVSDLTLKDPGSFFASGQTAVDFQELVSTFQSIDLHRISVRPLTSSELMVSWTVRSSNEVLSRIDGFKINVRSVPMSRCIAAVTSKSPNYLSTFRENSEDSESLNVYDADYDGFSFTGSVHCSFSSSKLLEQTIFMANTNSLRTNSKEASGHVTQNIIVMQSVSRDHPDAKAVVGGLLPFSCYETDIEAFKDDPTYGRILSRSSRSELALTLDAPPSFSPELISAEWLLQINPVKSEHKTESQRVNYTSPSEGIRLSWKPLELRMAHGALLGYAVHILANESQFSRSLHVSADIYSKNIRGLNPFVDYVIYISGVNCKGEGVRGPGYHLRSIAAGLRNPMKSDYELNILENFAFPTWAYFLLFGFIVFWIIFGLFIHFVVRHTSRKQCFKPSTSYFTASGSNVNTQHQKTLRRNNLGGICLGTCCNFLTFHKSKLESNFILGKNVGTVLMSSEQQERETGHLLHRLNSPQSKLHNNKPASECKPTNLLSASGKNEIVSTGRSHGPLPLFECNNSNLTGNEDVEVYASSDPSVCSNNLSYLPSAVLKKATGFGSDATILSQNGLVEESMSGESNLTSKPKLPDSINIPFPMPPTCQSNLCAPKFGYQSNVLNFSDPSNRLTTSDRYASHQLDESTDLRKFTLEDAVPAYASCSVFDIHKSDSNDHSGQHSGTPDVVLLRKSSNFCTELKDYNQVNFNSNSFSLMDPLQPTEFVGPADRNHLLLPEDFHNVSWCNWHFASHNINSPVTREEQRQNAIPPPPEYPPPPLPSASSKVCDLPNLWIPISASEDLKRLELKNNQLRFVSDDSSLPSGGTYLSNCYSPLSGAYAETRYVSCTVPNSNVEFQNTGSCIVNSQANNFIELPSSNCIKQCLSPNIRYVTELHGSMCLMNGAHRLSPLGSAYPNTSVIINHGQFDSRLRGNNCQSLTDNSGNGESSSGLSATSGLGSTAIGSGSAKYPGCRRPDDMHPVNGHTSSCNSSNCSNVHMSIMHQNHNTSLYSSPSKQQIVHSNPKSILQLCNTSSASNSFCSSSANSKDGNTKEMEHYISKSNNNDLSKSFQCTMADDILSNNTTEFSSLHGYGKLQQKGGKQQQSTNSLVVCNPIISSSGGNFREFSMLSTEPPLLLPTTTSTLTYDHYFTESNFNNDLSHGSGVILVSNRDSNKSATSNTIRTIRT
ncbi:Protein sax-3 isoform 4 [Schistosoma japonicum]|uniref:Protein sax-3 isoform 4 n=2 Tax=Schistosoma japonicum TaxID=6182 RepID=A0A4Z2CVY2_SCHJA|nr:Protein sax-3 isoform 4 [Schistosoma japonicum]